MGPAAKLTQVSTLFTSSQNLVLSVDWFEHCGNNFICSSGETNFDFFKFGSNHIEKSIFERATHRRRQCTSACVFFSKSDFSTENERLWESHSIGAAANRSYGAHQKRRDQWRFEVPHRLLRAIHFRRQLVPEALGGSAVNPQACRAFLY